MGFFTPNEVPPPNVYVEPFNKPIFNTIVKSDYQVEFEVNEVVQSIRDRSFNYSRCTTFGCSYHVHFGGLLSENGFVKYIESCIRTDTKIEYRCCNCVARLKNQEINRGGHRQRTRLRYRWTDGYY